jgi:TonB family protein
VRLEATGRVSDVRVVRSSSHEILDDAALEAIHRLGPLPFPDSLPPRPLLVRIPLVFDLH